MWNRIDDQTHVALTRRRASSALLTIINIGACSVPPHDRARFVRGTAARESEPTINSIMTAKSRLDLIRSPDVNICIHFSISGGMVVR
jgi:hypothetical protein